MAENTNKEKVVISFDTNADDASRDVSKLSASIDQTTESTSKANKATKELTDSKDKAAKSTKNQAGALDELNNATGGAIEQVKGLSKSFLALLANPVVLVITAIVGALALLYKAFTSTDAGAEKMEQAMAGISATIDVLRDRVLKVGSAIAKFFSGDFKGALAEARGAVSGIGAEIADEFSKAAEATRVLQELEDTMRDLSVSRAKLNRDLVGAREALQDENTSYSEKKRLLKEVTAAEQAQTKSELEAAQKKLAAIRAQNALSDISDEKKDAAAQLEKDVFALQEESFRNQIKLNKENARLDKEEAARKKAIADAAKAAQKEALEARKKELDEINSLSDEIESGIAKDKAGRDAKKKAQDEKDRTARIQGFLDEAEAKKVILDKEIEDEKAAALAKKANQDLLVSQGEALINNVKTLAGKNKAIQKAAIVADGAIGVGKAIANTAEAVTKDLAKGAPFSAPLVALDLAVGATSVASIIQGTNKALQAVGGGSAPSSPSLPSAGGVNGAPQVGFQASSENQIATSINNSQQALPPIQAFVVGSQVTTQQSLDANLVTENSFGG